MVLDDPQPDSDDDRLRQGQKRGMNKLLALSMLGAGLALLIALLFFAF